MVVISGSQRLLVGLIKYLLLHLRHWELEGPEQIRQDLSQGLQFWSVSKKVESWQIGVHFPAVN
jgi:hypothetical protein